jgi:hypothetical protein
MSEFSVLMIHNIGTTLEMRALLYCNGDCHLILNIRIELSIY